ncbi:MAG TPA: site-specific integrase [Terracidiphilus sp.]|nr:site-specific integrase [Terracidiphilus sp.]
MPRKPRQEKRKGIFERVKGSNIWWIRYTNEQGKRVAAKVGTFAAAVHVYERRTAAIRLGVLLPNSPRRGAKFSELVADAIKFSEKHHRASKDFKQRVNLALDEFGDRVAESITTRELQDWVDEMAEQREWTGGTRNRFKSSLSTVFREGMRAGKITVNPARLIRRSKESLGRVRFLSYEEEAKLRKAIAATLPGRIKDEGESAFAQLDVALHTGMRKSEQFTATWDQVDLERGFIYLSMTKNGADRFVTLNSAAVQVLRRLQERHKRLGLPPESTLFHSKRDGLIKNPRKWFATALEQAKIKGVTWHTLRHTFASRLVMAGVDLKTVQELMGHKTIAMTARYAHLAPTHKLQALETLVRPGSVSVQSGYKLATNAKRSRRTEKLNSFQLVESK